MRLIERFGILMILVGWWSVGVTGCGEESSAQAPYPPKDTDSDTDVGIGTDTGTGVEEWDTTPLPGVSLMPNEEGFMKTEENTLGIQGAWYTFGCDGAVIDPPKESTFTNPGRMCFSGTAPQVTDMDGDGNLGSLEWGAIWGAGMGFDTCAQSEEEAVPGTDPVRYRLSECPYNPNLATQLIGVSVRFSGYVHAEELRILFNEGDSVANSYYVVDPADVAAGTVLNVAFKDPLVATHYDTGLKPSNTVPDNILAIQFQIPTNAEGQVDWDFCVDAIAAMTAE